jgi:hypothetical protein
VIVTIKNIMIEYKYKVRKFCVMSIKNHLSKSLDLFFKNIGSFSLMSFQVVILGFLSYKALEFFDVSHSLPFFATLHNPEGLDWTSWVVGLGILIFCTPLFVKANKIPFDLYKGGSFVPFSLFTLNTLRYIFATLVFIMTLAVIYFLVIALWTGSLITMTYFKIDENLLQNYAIVSLYGSLLLYLFFAGNFMFIFPAACRGDSYFKIFQMFKKARGYRLKLALAFFTIHIPSGLFGFVTGYIQQFNLSAEHSSLVVSGTAFLLLILTLIPVIYISVIYKSITLKR